VNRLIISCIAFGLLGGCSDEPEVVVVEPIESDEVAYEEAAPLAWDDNEDGILSREEYLSLSTNVQDAWDVDQDGSLSSDEFKVGWDRAGFADATGALSTLDEDDDGMIAQAEIFDGDLWDKWDVNGSGLLEPSEFPYY